MAHHADALRVDAAQIARLLLRLEVGHLLLAHLPESDDDYPKAQRQWGKLCRELYVALRSAYGHFYLVRESDFPQALDLWNELLPPRLPDYLPLMCLVRHIEGRTDPPHWITQTEERLYRMASRPPEHNPLDTGLEEMYAELPW